MREIEVGDTVSFDLYGEQVTGEVEFISPTGDATISRGNEKFFRHIDKLTLIS